MVPIVHRKGKAGGASQAARFVSPVFTPFNSTGVVHDQQSSGCSI